MRCGYREGCTYSEGGFGDGGLSGSTAMNLVQKKNIENLPRKRKKTIYNLLCFGPSLLAGHQVPVTPCVLPEPGRKRATHPNLQVSTLYAGNTIS